MIIKINPEDYLRSKLVVNNNKMNKNKEIFLFILSYKHTHMYVCVWVGVCVLCVCLYVLIYIFLSYNVWKHERFPALISRQPEEIAQFR